MSSDSFYIKYKGRISGPVPVDDLRAALRHGSLTRAHLISRDGNDWRSVGNHPEFGANQEAQRSHGTTLAVEDGEAAQEEHQPTNAAPTAARHVAQDDEITWSCRGCGISLAASLSSLGQLVECPECGTPNVVRRQSPTAVSTESTADSRRRAAQRRVQEANLGVGIAAGVIGLVALHVPLFGDGDEYYFWWDAIREGSSRVAVGWIMLLLSGIALCIISPLTRGLSRGIIFVALPAIWLLVSAFATDTVLFLWLAPFAVLSGGVSWASHRPDSFRPRLTLCISGASACLASLVLLTLLLIEMDDGSQTVATTEAVVVLIGMIVGLAAGITSGILGITSIRAERHRGMQEALRYITLAAVAIPPAALLLALGSAGGLEMWGFRWEGWIALAVIRLLLFFAIIYILIARGILEIGLSAPPTAALAQEGESDSNG